MMQSTNALLSWRCHSSQAWISDVGQQILDLTEPPRLQRMILDGMGPRIAHIADFLGLPANTIEPVRILGIAS